VATGKDVAAPSAAAIRSGKDGAGNTAIASASASVTAANAKTLSLTGLITDTEYKIYSVLYDGDSNASAVVSNTARTKPLQLKSLTIVPEGKSSNILTGFSPDKFTYTGIVVPNETTEVKVTAIANADVFVGTLSINGEVGTTTVNVPVVEGGPTVISVVVKETGKSEVTYTVTLTKAGNANLDSMTIDGKGYIPGDTHMLDEYNTSSVLLKIKAVDSNATIWIGDNQIGNDVATNVTIGDATSLVFQIKSSGGEHKSYTIKFARPAAPSE
jgi:hypothetical protein